MLVEEAAPQQPQDVGARPHDQVTAGDLAVVAGRQEQVLAALAPVRPGQADVDDPPLPGIVDHAQHARRAFENKRAVVQVHQHGAVRSVVVAGEDHAARVDQVFPDRHGRVGRTQRQHCLTHRCHFDRGQGQQVRLYRPLEIQVVEHRPGRLVVRDSVEEPQRAQPGADFVRHLDTRRNRGAVRMRGHGVLLCRQPLPGSAAHATACATHSVWTVTAPRSAGSTRTRDGAPARHRQFGRFDSLAAVVVAVYFSSGRREPWGETNSTGTSSTTFSANEKLPSS